VGWGGAGSNKSVRRHRSALGKNRFLTAGRREKVKTGNPSVVEPGEIMRGDNSA